MDFAKNQKELNKQELELDNLYHVIPHYIIGENMSGILHVYTRDQHGNDANLKQVVKHSPSGMAWGYPGSGPADLALTIMTLYGRPELYQAFKWDIISKLPLEQFTLSQSQIVKWINNQRKPNIQYHKKGKLIDKLKKLKKLKQK